MFRFEDFFFGFSAITSELRKIHLKLIGLLNGLIPFFLEILLGFRNIKYNKLMSYMIFNFYFIIVKCKL